MIGPNGSGKTTLINCISGAFRTEPGTVTFGGEDITRLPPHIRTRRGIAGDSFQIPRPFRSYDGGSREPDGRWPDFAGRADEVVSAGRQRDTMMSISTWMGLASKADVLDRQAEPGLELRKMELARALATHPKLPVSDEAMAGAVHLRKSATRCWIS